MPDDEFARRARTLFDESVESLDGEALSRLNRNRDDALAGRGRRRRTCPAVVPAVGLAAVAAVAVLVARAPEEPLPLPEPARADAAADFEILLDGDELEMLHDLEFYSWVELEPETASNVG